TQTYLLSDTSEIDIDGLGGNDTLTIDDTKGLISVPDGIHYNGGDGFDKLILLQKLGGTQQDSDTYSVGPRTGEGTSIIVGPSGTQTVFFENLEPVLDTVLAASLTVNGTPADNSINYAAGATDAAKNGLITVDNFESIEFSNKAALTINAGAGQDTIS